MMIQFLEERKEERLEVKELANSITDLKIVVTEMVTIQKGIKIPTQPCEFLKTYQEDTKEKFAKLFAHIEDGHAQTINKSISNTRSTIALIIATIAAIAGIARSIGGIL